MSKYNIGDKVSAIVKEKTKTKYWFYGGIQCGDLYDCETKIVHPAFPIVGIITTRKLNKPNSKKLIKVVQTTDGKNYRLDSLTNIQKL